MVTNKSKWEERHDHYQVTTTLCRSHYRCVDQVAIPPAGTRRRRAALTSIGLASEGWKGGQVGWGGHAGVEEVDLPTTNRKRRLHLPLPSWCLVLLSPQQHWELFSLIPPGTSKVKHWGSRLADIQDHYTSWAGYCSERLLIIIQLMRHLMCLIWFECKWHNKLQPNFNVDWTTLNLHFRNIF